MASNSSLRQQLQSSAPPAQSSPRRGVALLRLSMPLSMQGPPWQLSCKVPRRYAGSGMALEPITNSWPSAATGSGPASMPRCRRQPTWE
ncbi:hypothetical protein BS78_02G082500 [Paspalum vaginatum]|nr:hypothetical protein BS78_02G082500 [Paspalum vaginatum]